MIDETKLLTRDEFREGVFARDKNTCVVPGCNKPAKDAHHIIERRLWDDEGYYLSNGASVCEEHHRLAEINKILPQTLRTYVGIKSIKIPAKMSVEKDYTKWGDVLELNKLGNIKYPTTYYLPFSNIPSEHKKDLGLVKHLLNCPLVITKKMDGSNVKLTREKVTARNGHSAEHVSFDYLKSCHSQIRHYLPIGKSLFGEWLYAKHSIHYKEKNKLENYLQLFGVYDNKTQMWESWEEVEKIAKQQGVCTVPVIGYVRFEKEWQLQKELTRIAEDVIKEGHEGIVVRNIFPFHGACFNQNLMKYVRPDHVQTDKHWNTQKIVRNEVK